MALPLGLALNGAKAIAPTVGPEAAKYAKKLIGEWQLKRRAHDIAWQRGGKVGQVTFLDGVKRWVVVDGAGTPIIAVPSYDDGSAEALAEALAGIDFGRCMHAPDRELKAEKQRDKAEEKRRKAHAKAAKDPSA